MTEQQLRNIIRNIISESFLGIKSKDEKKQENRQRIKEIYGKYKKEALGLAYKFIEIAEFDMELIKAGEVNSKQTRILEKIIDNAQLMSNIEDKFDQTSTSFDDKDIGKKKTSYWKNKFSIAQQQFTKSANDYLTIVGSSTDNNGEISIDDKDMKKVVDKEVKKQKQKENLKTLKSEKLRLNSQLESELKSIKNIRIQKESYGVTKFMNMFLSKILIGKSSQEIMSLGSEMLSDFDMENESD